MCGLLSGQSTLSDAALFCILLYTCANVICIKLLLTYLALPWGEPFEVTAVDIMGPYQKTALGNEYITIIDLFGKWAESITVRNHTAPIMAKALVDHVFTRVGLPLFDFRLGS